MFCPVVSGDGPESVVTTHSGRAATVFLSSDLVHSLLLLLQTPDPRAFGLLVPGGASLTLGKGK